MKMNYTVTKNDCRKVIERLNKIFDKVGLSDEVSFLVYGSHLGNWNNGISDIDGIIYFRRHLPFEAVMRPKIIALQKEIGKLYSEIDFLNDGHFFKDIFILDYLHIQDCRFVVFDKYFVPFNPDRAGGFGKEVGYKVCFGADFVDAVRPNIVSLADSKELETAFGLQKLRNYLLFEIPRPVQSIDLDYQKEVAKSLKILPRNIKFILDEPGVVNPQNLSAVRSWLKDVDCRPLARFFEAHSSPAALKEFLSKWHDSEDNTFFEAWECYEKVLERVVKNSPMKSIRCS